MSVNSQPTLFTRLGFDPAYLSTFEDKLFIEGPQTARRLTNFFALLLFATVIATYGVLSNSTATVIGAMIVAPLMGPMMATGRQLHNCLSQVSQVKQGRPPCQPDYTHSQEHVPSLAASHR